MRALVGTASFALAAACGPPTSTSTHGTTYFPAKTSSTSTPKLPGSCIDPEHDARTRLGSDAQGEGLRVERRVDLDEDGIADPFVTHEVFCGTGGCDWHLYVQRGTCAYHVGEMFAVLPLSISEKAKSLGLLDLTGTIRNGCTGVARTEVVASFDGARYRIVRERTCTCPKEDEAKDATDFDATCEDWHPPAEKKP